MRPILVVGATGLLGSEITRLLCGSRSPVRALVRPGSAGGETLQRLGAEIAVGDLTDARSLEDACKDVGTVISTATAVNRRRRGDSLRRVDRDGPIALAEAAQRAGVRRFIYISMSPNLPRDTPLVDYKREVEIAVRASGMGWVLVQPGPFMERWLAPRAGVSVTSGRAALLGFGDAPVSYVSYRDVARVVVSIAGSDSAFHKSYLPIAGPEALTPREAVRRFEAESGRRIGVAHVPLSLTRGIGRLARAFDPALSSMLGIAAYMAEEGDVIEPVPAVQQLMPRPVTVRDHARAAARAALTERVRVLLRGTGQSR